MSSKIVAWCASYLDVEARVRYAYQQLESLSKQTARLHDLQMSVSVNGADDVAAGGYDATDDVSALRHYVRNTFGKGSDVTLQRPPPGRKRVEQFEHIRHLYTDVATTAAGADAVLFFDDDDLCGPRLVERYTQRLDAGADVVDAEALDVQDMAIYCAQSTGGLEACASANNASTFAEAETAIRDLYARFVEPHTSSTRYRPSIFHMPDFSGTCVRMAPLDAWMSSWGQHNEFSPTTDVIFRGVLTAPGSSRQCVTERGDSEPLLFYRRWKHVRYWLE